MIQHSRLEPGFHLPAQTRSGVDLSKEGSLSDTVEALGDIGIEHILGFLADSYVNGSNRILTGAARAKSITVGFKARLPFGFEGRGDQPLAGTVCQDGNTQRP